MTLSTGADRVDIVVGSMLQRKLEALVAEMDRTLVNTAYSSHISVSRRCATAVFTEQGRLVAVSNPLYAYPLSMIVERVIDYFLYDLSAEDVLLTNDPYGGGTRVQEFTLVAPVARGDSIGMFVAVCGQTEDFAGDVRGNFHPGATEIWAEGARCSPVRLVRDGKLRKDVLQTLLLNSRSPVALELDLHAMRAAASIGRRRLEEVFEAHNAKSLLENVNWVLDYSERRMRSSIGRIPNGRYEGVGTLGRDPHAGCEKHVRAVLDVHDGHVTIDLSGSDAQSTGFVNATRAVSSSFAFLPVLAACGGGVPCNAGSMRCIDVVTCPKTVVDPVLPAPVGWGFNHVGAEVADAVRHALEAALPGVTPRIAANGVLLQAVHHLSRHGQTVEQAELLDLSSFGQGDSDAAPDHDGWGLPGLSAAVPLPSIELYESTRPGLIEAIEFATDSAGPGKWRGSPGTRAVIRLPRPTLGELSLDAVVVPRVPGSLEHGGMPGSQNEVVIECETTIAIENSLRSCVLPGAARVTLTMGGGCGWGDPAERAPELVAADVASGLLSPGFAAARYGVVLEAGSFKVDSAETARRREALTSARGTGAA